MPNRLLWRWCKSRLHKPRPSEKPHGTRPSRPKRGCAPNWRSAGRSSSARLQKHNRPLTLPLPPLQPPNNVPKPKPAPRWKRPTAKASAWPKKARRSKMRSDWPSRRPNSEAAEAAAPVAALPVAPAIPVQAPAVPAAAPEVAPQVAPVAPLPPSPTSPPVAPAVPAVPPLVMIADDSKVVRVKTSRLLMQHGYRVVLAEDGQQAAMLLETEVPMALITDVEMPGMDGFELTRYVRLHPLAQHIPVFMITSADDRLQAEAEEAGVTRLLGKPYAEDVLLALVAQAVQAQPKRANGPA
jgi:CheY-like chemotaxis protein